MLVHLGLWLCGLLLAGAACAEEPPFPGDPAPAGEAGAPLDLSRERVELLLRRYLATDSRKEREAIEEEFLAMEKAGLQASTLHEVMEFGEAYERSPKLFTERGKVAAPSIEWPSQRVGVRELGEQAPDVYSIVFPPDYAATGSHTYPVVLDLGEGVASALTGGIGNSGVLAVFVHPDAVPEQGFTASRQGQSLVLSVLRDLPLRAWVDPDRVFLTGGGRYGNSVFYLAAHHAHLFAGALPFAGQLGEFQMFERNSQHLHWMFVSRNPGPTTLGVYEWNFDCFERLKKLRVDAHFRLLDQGLDPRSFIDDAQGMIRNGSRQPWPAELHYRLNDADHAQHYWLSIDKVRAPGRPHVLKLQGEFGQVTDTRTLNSNLAEVTAQVSTDRHRIEITAENVRHLSLLLSPKLVDFSAEVDIVVNGKSRWKEKPQPALRLMLIHYRASRDASAMPWQRVQLIDL